MANYTITSANVHVYDGAICSKRPEKFGATMTPGQACYYDLSASEWVLLDANVEHSAGVGLGVVIVGAAEDAHGIVCTGGPIDLGTTLTNGMPVIASTTAGALAPVTDWSGYSAAWQYHFGYPSAASVLYLKPYKTLAEVA